MIIVDDPRDVRLFDGLIILNVGGLYGDTSMAKKIGYTPISIFAAGCETIATAAALTIPATAPFAVGIGTAASAVAGGIELNDEEKNIKDNLDKAMDKALATIDKKYRLSLHTEKYTDNCLTELKREVMGENTSVEEFVRNTEIKGFEPSIALVIQGILKKHIVTLNRDPEIIWSDEYTENAAKDMASILVDAIKSVFENVDHLRILKAIYKSEERIVTELHQATNQVIGEIRNVKPIPTEAPLSLTYIPPAINLIGREKDIQGIYDLFEQHNIVFIHADGGVGKTAAAAKIVNQIKDDITSGKGPYKHVAWITSTGDLKSDLTGLNIPLVETMKTPEEKIQSVTTYLQSNPTFLVIDNMDKPPTREDSNELNTITGRTKVLVTSRADIPYAEEYLLVELDPDSALVLFYRHFTRKVITIEQIRDRKDCLFGENIVEAATYNALFIELIGKMAYADHWKLENLWEKLREAVFSVDSKHPIYAAHGDDGKLLEHIKKLYEMSELSEKQKEIMSFMALFPPEHSIFFDVFEWAGFEDDEVDNLGVLQDRGWIERGEEGYLIHTMVRGSIERQVGEVDFDEDRYENLIDELGEVNQYIFDNMVFTKIQERIVVPVTLCGLLLHNKSNRKNTITLYSNIAMVFRSQGDYRKALKYCKDAISALENGPESEKREKAIICNNIAMVYQDLGNYALSLKYYRKALDIYGNMVDAENLDISSTYNNMAVLYSEQGDNKNALDYSKKALAIHKKIGVENIDTALIYNNMATLYCGQGNTKDALEYCLKALSIQEKESGIMHQNTAMMYNSLATIYYEQSNYNLSLKYVKLAEDIYEKLLGIHHPYTVRIYNNIAAVYHSQGNKTEALKYYKKVLTSSENMLREGHPTTLLTYQNIAVMYRDTGNYEDSIKYLKKALAINEKQFGVENLTTARLYDKIATVYTEMGCYKEALNDYYKALLVFKKLFGIEHIETAKIIYNLATLFFAQCNYSKAFDYYERVFTIRWKLLGIDHIETVLVYCDLGITYFHMNEYEKAKEYLNNASRILSIVGTRQPHSKRVREKVQVIEEILRIIEST